MSLVLPHGAMMDQRVWTIGSGEGCDFVTPHSRVSRRHCRLEIKENRATIEDLGSTNGTYVEGRRITEPTTITPSSLVQLGQKVALPWLDYRDEDALSVLSIGRDPDSGMVIDDPSVAGKHARILFFPKHAILEDLGSATGTRVKSESGSDAKIQRALLLSRIEVSFGGHRLPVSELLERGPTKLGSNESPKPVSDEALNPLARMRGQLASLGIVKTEEWDAAAAKCVEPKKLIDILSQIAKLPAAWSTPENECPRLTKFQISQLMDGHPDHLKIDHYILFDRLGTGGMGFVFKVRDLANNRYAAMKMLADPWDGHADISESLRKRFARETGILQKLNHPGICEYYGAGVYQQTPYIVMELLHGQDFQTIIKESVAANCLPDVDALVEISRQVCETLRYVHEQGIVHRDIKPANIFLTDNSDVKLLDVGIARQNFADGENNESFQTQAGVQLGTPEYMPPEQWTDAKTATPSSDIYSLGCTLFCLFAGRPPFQGGISALVKHHLKTPAPKLSTVRRDAPKQLERVIDKMLAKSPAHRYKSMAEAFDDLNRSAAESKFSGMLPILIVGGTVITVAVLAGAAFLLLR